MNCYFQSCSEKPVTREHAPPKAFFPKDQRKQLITVPSCSVHNNDKSDDDQYVLAHICINSSPRNRAREIFFDRIVPQLSFNQEAFRKLLAKDCQPLADGVVAYRVDIARFDRFFDSLACAVIRHVADNQLPADYTLHHIYHNLTQEQTDLERAIEAQLTAFYSAAAPTIAVLDFGAAKCENEPVYKVNVFGIPKFVSSITLVHEFFGHFKVTSMVSKKPQSFPASGA